MTNDITSELLSSVVSGFIDRKTEHATEEFSPRLLLNQKDDTVWDHLRSELQACSQFIFAVAFITPDMLVPLKVVLADLAKRGIKGKILTSVYLSFNRPEVFAELLKIPNVTVRISTQQGFHVKGYLFEHQGSYDSLIIGSSNLTRTALLANYEWNLRLTSHQDGELTQQIRQKISEAWQTALPLTSEWLADYTLNYQAPLPDAGQAGRFLQTERAAETIIPNRMQQEALAELQQLRNDGGEKGLVISATGTGKTYLGAFDVQQFRPRRMLFIVHREQILKRAMQSFYKVLGGKKNEYGILSGNHFESNAKYLFATIQTLSKQAVLAQFSRTEFDYLLLDEAHRAGAQSYRRVLKYFQPLFCMGMTATPERTDDFSIYELFDYNLAYENRLQDALEENLLCPFHYVGIQDYEYQGKVIDEQTPLRRLASNERIDYVLQQLDYYGYSGQAVHGLIFCSRKDEAKEVARLLSAKGHPATALSGTDTIAQRQAAVNHLEQGALEYLVTVDIFNEGIDIPCINQVVMMRSTQSSIVFIQQLGRGLRKAPGKEFVTVIDFIGNYKNNYLIPLALTGDKTRSKDNAREELELQPTIGLSTINFTEVARARIYETIQAVKLDALAFLRKDYQQLKEKLGRIPLLLDFQKFGGTDAAVFADNHLLANYYHFLLKMKEDVVLSKFEDQVLSFVTKELLNGMRQHELLLLKVLLEHENVSLAEFKHLLKEHHCYCDQATLRSVLQILNLSFFKVKAGKRLKADNYGGKPIVSLNAAGYHLNSTIRASLRQHGLFARLYKDVLQTGLLKARKYQSEQPFTLLQKYTRKDVCRLLNWEKDVSAPLYGYRVGKTACPLFVTYTAEESAQKRSANYENEFINTSLIRWYTRSPRHLYSDEVQQLLQVDEQGKRVVKLHLFMKKSDAEGKNFFYCGECKIEPGSVKEELMQLPHKKPRAVVSMLLRLQTPLQYRRFLLLTGKK
ncbi:DUF3427 domain-containing protein [Liquorilactobacillus satsumensis]|uniref:DUF3427 domain-containing protein n=1 Tax=Liquorilactobacillus satsumensis TaxID=259059 RepID=UPI001E49F7D7|nr:DEAD/DEAH box helicase [Liquorilactobacillus satsumensis]MCC7667676.1 NgoFVII family restriction endonuclease [Liquorilactobacillus satsumensis]